MNDRTIRFENTLNLADSTQRYLLDYALFGHTFFPAAGHAALSLEAARVILGSRPLVLSKLRIQRWLPLSALVPCTLAVEINPIDALAREIKIVSRRGREKELVCTGEISAGNDSPSSLFDDVASRQKCLETEANTTVYQQLRQLGIEAGPDFQTIKRLYRSEGEVYAELQLGSEISHVDYVCHPALLDGCFQVCAYFLKDEGADCPAYLPESIEQLTLNRALTDRVSVHVRKSSSQKHSVSCKELDITLLDPSTGEVVATLCRVRFRGATRINTRQQLQENEQVDDVFYKAVWLENRRRSSGARGVETRTAGNSPRQTWLVFADDNGVAVSLAKQLEASGDSVLLVSTGQAGSEMKHRHLLLPSRDKEGISQLLANMAIENFAGIIHCWALDAQSVQSSAIDEALYRVCGSVLHLVQALVEPNVKKPRGVWLVVQGAQMLPGQESIALMQSPLVGLSRTIAVEHPDLNVRLVDLDPTFAREESAANLFEEIQIDDDEDQVAIRNDVRWMVRIFPHERPALAPLPIPYDSYELVLHKDKQNFELQPKEQTELLTGKQVEVEVGACGIANNDDRLFFENRGESLIAADFAGTITAKGNEVSQLHIGDSVFGIGVATFTDRLVTTAEFVARIPARLSLTEAASLPSAFLTAYACLCPVELTADSTILMHADPSGVGLAAAQIAMKSGAQVFATAGDAYDREQLEQLGVSRIFDRQHSSWADDIMNMTGGIGVDIVLNSLPGNLISASMNIVKDGGRFIETGNQGSWTEEEVLLAYPWLKYEVFSLNRLALKFPDRIQAYLDTLCQLVDRDEFVPARVVCFPIKKAPEVFYWHQQLSHKIKMVFTTCNYKAERSFRCDRTYIVTGGLGGIGLELCDWLVDFGARNIAIFSRSQPSPNALEYIGKWQASGATIKTYSVDVGDSEGLKQVFASIRNELPPINGVFHAAGVITDAIILNQTWEHFQRAFRSKIHGSWLLHEHTRQDRLDFFVMFSSAASLFGSVGQANYAAANSFMDALAHFRHLDGRAGLSINWGPWSQVGKAAELMRRGLWTKGKALSPAQGFKALSLLLPETNNINIAVAEIDETSFFQEWNCGRPLLRAIRVRFEEQHEVVSDLQRSVRALIAEIKDDHIPDRFSAVLSQYIEEQVRAVLKWPVEEPLHAKQLLFEVGMDSFLAVELSSRFTRDLTFKSTVTAGILFAHPSIEALTQHITRQLQLSTVRTAETGKEEEPFGKRALVQSSTGQGG